MQAGGRSSFGDVFSRWEIVSGGGDLEGVFSRSIPGRVPVRLRATFAPPEEADHIPGPAKRQYLREGDLLVSADGWRVRLAPPHCRASDTLYSNFDLIHNS